MVEEESRRVDSVQAQGAEGGQDAATMVRHEERLQVATQWVAHTRVRVGKRLLEEHQTLTVPLRREELNLVEEAVRADERAATAEPPADGGDDVIVTLYAERPVVTIQRVPVERIRLRRGVVVERRQVSAELAREQVELHQQGPEERQRDR